MVECNRHNDCSPPMKCLPWGQCAVDADYECDSDGDCVAAYENHLMLCSNHRCVLPCENDAVCTRGSLCVAGECFQEWCPSSGVCSEDWESIDGSLFCRYTGSCSDQDLILGGCGLNGECVECFTDSHCEEGICNSSGICQSRECQVDTDCGADEHCLDFRCSPPCNSQLDCDASSTCDSGFCRKVLCDSSGRCDTWGWQPILGSLDCLYEPCPNSDLMPGVCALERQCVECIVDNDCEGNEYCAIYAKCVEIPECGPETWKTCATFQECVDGKCIRGCEDDNDCYYGYCTPEKYCFYERCGPDGTCPDGWRPGTKDSAPDSLACELE